MCDGGRYDDDAVSLERVYNFHRAVVDRELHTVLSVRPSWRGR
jgi:hypothetical protein